MRMRLAAFAACIVAFVVAWPATAADPAVPHRIMTLDDALVRVADAHPELRQYGARSNVLVAERTATLASANASEPAMIAVPVRQALQTAWRQHPSYRVTEAELAAARARLDAADKPLYNPELEFSSGDERSERTTTAGFNLSLDVSGKRRARSDAASARVDQATAEARLRRRDFALM
mgnify:FL=1